MSGAELAINASSDIFNHRLKGQRRGGIRGGIRSIKAPQVVGDIMTMHLISSHLTSSLLSGLK